MTRDQRREALLQLDKEQLIEIILDLQDQFGGLQQRLTGVEQTIAKRDEVPSFVKPNKASRQQKIRKKRAQGFARRRDVPTRTVMHALDQCPDCGHGLRGGWVHGSRQIIEIPFAPAEVVEHQFLRRRCGVCGRTHLPKVNLSAVAVGKHRFGAGVMALVTHLGTVCRLSVGLIQSLLGQLYHLRISRGEIVGLLHATAKHGAALYEQIRDQVRAARSVNADETGWREDGINGYVWSFSTDKERFFTIDRSRGAAVPKGVLGEEFRGVLGSDFYSGYHFYEGEHQRCWAHLLRDIKDLSRTYAQDASVAQWAEAIGRVYHDAAEFARTQKQQEAQWREGDAHLLTKQAHLKRLKRERLVKRKEYMDRLQALAIPWLGQDAPQRLLSKRIERHLTELFAFVEYDDVSPTNNLAERAIRPSVIRRKVSGGTRSPKGSRTRSVLMTLCDTWAARGQNTLASCQKMLTDPKHALARA